MAEETITRDELAEALRTHQLKAIPGRLVNLADPDETAAGLFQAVIDAREPRYEPGAMYQDEAGQNWEYRPDASRAGSWDDCPWLKPGDSGVYSRTSPEGELRRLVPDPHETLPATTEGEMYQDKLGQRFCRQESGWLIPQDGIPVPDGGSAYPFRRLLPEPSWLPEAVIRAVADILTEYTERERAEEATARVCKLIRTGRPGSPRSTGLSLTGSSPSTAPAPWPASSFVDPDIQTRA